MVCDPYIPRNIDGNARWRTGSGGVARGRSDRRSSGVEDGNGAASIRDPDLAVAINGQGRGR